MQPRALAICLLASTVASMVGFAGPARADMIAGWDFSQYFGAGFLSLDAATFTDTLDANYSDIDPTFGAGSESAAFGTMYIDGSFGSTNVDETAATAAFTPTSGSLASNLTAPGSLVDFDAHSVLTNEGQMFTSLLSMTAQSAVSVVFEADLTTDGRSGKNWSVRFGGKTFSGATDVTVEFAADGGSYASFGTVNLTDVDAAFDVALDTGTSTTGYVRLGFTTTTAQAIIDNVSLHADFGCTGSDSIGAYEGADARFHLRNTNDAGADDVNVKFQAANRQPIPGDFDGDCASTIGAYDTAAGRFFLKNSNAPGNADLVFRFQLGGAGNIGIVGDWDGDGVETIGVYVPSSGRFLMRNTNGPGTADIGFRFGAAGAGLIPIVGDWDGDGSDSIGLYDPATGRYRLRNSNSGGLADAVFRYGGSNVQFRPIAGDWNGDGTDTIGVYNLANGQYRMRNTNSGGATDIGPFLYQGGGDTPIDGNWDAL